MFSNGPMSFNYRATPALACCARHFLANFSTSSIKAKLIRPAYVLFGKIQFLWVISEERRCLFDVYVTSWFSVTSNQWTVEVYELSRKIERSLYQLNKLYHRCWGDVLVPIEQLWCTKKLQNLIKRTESFLLISPDISRPAGVALEPKRECVFRGWGAKK